MSYSMEYEKRYMYKTLRVLMQFFFWLIVAYSLLVFLLGFAKITAESDGCAVNKGTYEFNILLLGMDGKCIK